MTPQELDALRSSTTTTVPVACDALSIGRTLGYRLARETGQLTNGVPVLMCGRKMVVPVEPLMKVLLGHD